MKDELLVFFMQWLSSSAPLLVALLQALVPVLALILAIYLVHLFNRKGRK